MSTGDYLIISPDSFTCFTEVDHYRLFFFHQVLRISRLNRQYAQLTITHAGRVCYSVDSLIPSPGLVKRNLSIFAVNFTAFSYFLSLLLAQWLDYSQYVY